MCVTFFSLWQYGVATISRLLKIIGLFCKRALCNRRYSAKEIYDFKEPTNRSHPIVIIRSYVWHTAFICVTYSVHMCNIPPLVTVVTSWLAPGVCGHGSFIRVTWLIHMWGQDSFICVTWRIHMCDMECWNMWHPPLVVVVITSLEPEICGHDSLIFMTWLIHTWYDSFTCVTCVTWSIRMCDLTSLYVWHDLFIYVTWRIYMHDVPYSCTWHPAFICVTWHIHTRDITYLYVWNIAFTSTTYLLPVCETTHSYVWHDAFIRATDAFICVTSPIHVWHDSFIYYVRPPVHICEMTHSYVWRMHTCDMTQSYVWHNSFLCVKWTHS